MWLPSPQLAQWVYAAGALLFVPMLMLMRYEGRETSLLRLRRLQLFGGVAFLASAGFMIMQTSNCGPLWARQNNLWLMALAIGCVYLLYTSFRIPQELRKLGLVLLCAVMLTGCRASQGQYELVGNNSVHELEGSTLSLRIFDSDTLRTINQSSVEHGKFNFSGEFDSVVMCNLFKGDICVMPVVIEQGRLQVQIDEKLQNVTGGAMNDSLYLFIHRKSLIDDELQMLPRRESQMLLDGMDFEHVQQTLMEESHRLMYELDRLETNFIVSNSGNVMGPGVFMILTSGMEYPYITPQIEEILMNAKPYFLAHPYVKKWVEAARQNMEMLHTGASMDPPNEPEW